MFLFFIKLFGLLKLVSFFGTLSCVWDINQMQVLSIYRLTHNECYMGITLKV